MATDLPRRRPIAAKPKSRRKADGGILRCVNATVEPRVRSGFASPGPLPAGLIVLETVGRRSGKTYRNPLLATVGLGGYLWITTVLGSRANWLRNAQANPDIRYWMKGRPHEGRALVSAPGLPAPNLKEFPHLTRWAALRSMKLSRALGFGMLIIVPNPTD